jgi:hypothetical protein
MEYLDAIERVSLRNQRRGQPQNPHGAQKAVHLAAPVFDLDDGRFAEADPSREGGLRISSSLPSFRDPRAESFVIGLISEPVIEDSEDGIQRP